jgi:hypothetical protein
MKKLLRNRAFVLFLGIAMLFAITTAWLLHVPNRILQFQPSPDGKIIAEYIEYKESSATSTDLSAIELKRRFSPFRHTVLAAWDYGGKLSVRWLDAHNLLVTCSGCSEDALLAPCVDCAITR